MHTSAWTKKFDYFCTHTTYWSLLFTMFATQNIKTKKNMQLIQGFVHDRMWGAVGGGRGGGERGEARVKTIRTRSTEAEKGHGSFLQAIPITCNSYSSNYQPSDSLSLLSWAHLTLSLSVQWAASQQALGNNFAKVRRLRCLNERLTPS